ncbi:Lrp/AsnC family transcriptional regulator [Persephonella sp.]|uniref:siroheme decarboxylase subunit alpha n=1 Tax=Persephonella sp. TaxID=2060922 RepID=UPI0025FC0277|nr:Lrp/AsnC family transcriptional regulator [Persephonella sp.]
MIQLSDFEKSLLKIVQGEIPVNDRPFSHIAQNLGSTEEEVIKTLKNLKEKKIIRQISPIYDTKSLGYDSSLVAFKVNGDIEKVAEIINTHPGVSHNYQRTDDFNIWFTIAVPPDSEFGLEKTVQLLAEISDVDDYVILKTVKLYKIGVKLSFEDIREKDTVKRDDNKKNNINLTEIDKKIIKITQEDIPLVEKPFEILAQKADLPQEHIIQKLQFYKENGVMRRFAAILYHRKAGFKANGMTVWNVPPDREDEVGYKLASFRSVSHCYKRTTNEKWRYNIFSMIHGKTKEELENFVFDISQEIGIKDFKILYSTKEFKKRRIKYFSDQFYKWEVEIKNGRYTGSDIKS